MTHIEKRLGDIRSKIRTVKENRNNKWRFPREIIHTLTIVEMKLEDQLFSMREKVEISF